MALSATHEADSGEVDRIRPGWHRWLSPTGRHFAARTAPLPVPLSGPVLLSAASAAELDEALANAGRV